LFFVSQKTYCTKVENISCNILPFILISSPTLSEYLITFASSHTISIKDTEIILPLIDMMILIFCRLPRLFWHLYVSIYNSSSVDHVRSYDLWVLKFLTKLLYLVVAITVLSPFLNSLRPIMVGCLQGCKGLSWVSLPLPFSCLLQGML